MKETSFPDFLFAPIRGSTYERKDQRLEETKSLLKFSVIGKYILVKAWNF